LLIYPEELLVDPETLGSGRRGNPELAKRLDESSAQEPAPIENKKQPTPSSSRPPPPHPILKKSRQPSTSSHRPTARFASPPDSRDGGGNEGDNISPGTATTSSEMPPPPLPSLLKKKRTTTSTAPPTETTPATGTTPTTETTWTDSEEPEFTPDPAVHLSLPRNSMFRGEKGTTMTTRKIVVSTAASRRKPVIVRRRSSQSSTGSNPDTRAANSGSTTATKHARSKRAPLTSAQLLGQGSVSPRAREPVLREPVVSEPVVREPLVSEPVLSAKAAGKRPAKATTGKRSAPPSVAARPNGQQRRSTWDVRDSIASPALRQSLRETVEQPSQAPPPVAGFVGDSQLGSRAPPMVRSRSNNTEGLHRHREPGLALLPSQATSSVATYITTARGQFDTETFTSDSIVPEATDIPDSVLFGSQPSSSPLLEPHFTPTPPNLAPPILFGRSKSELTILLERERERERASEES
jgi:hypothetical protein